MTNQSFSQMRLRNAESIIESVRHHMEISRADLARETALSPATVSSIVDELIKTGFLSETGARSTTAGRRPIGLVFNPEAGLVAGISIEPELVSLVIADLDGQSKATQVSVIEENAEALEITELCIRLLRSATKASGVSLQSIGALGLAAPGPLKEDYPLSPGARRPEFYKSIKELLARKLSIQVNLDSMVNMAALAESLTGAGQGANSLIYFRIGQAMRSAVLINNKLIYGKNNLAGEVGHIVMLNQSSLCHCGKTGCANTIAALPHFLERCRREGIQIESANELPDLVAHGNLRLHALLAESAEAIAYAMAALINTLAPDAVIISAPYLSCGAAFHDPLRSALSKFTQADLLTQCKILPCQLKGSQEALGAALSAMQTYPLVEQLAAKV